MKDDLEPGPARRGGLGRKLEGTSKRWLARFLARAFPARPLSPQDLEHLVVKRLLVVRQHNQMGDMVCALPALAALRRAYPRAHLTFLAGPLSEQLLLGQPDLDELIVFRKASFWRPWQLGRLVRRLRWPRPDLAVVMTTVSFSTTSALLAWVSGARVRAGGSSLPFGTPLSRALYHLELPIGRDGAHEVEQNLVPLRALGIPTPVEAPRLVACPEALDHARSYLKRTVGSGRPRIVVHAGAGKRPNIWPTERFASVVRGLQEERGAQVVLLEGPNDRDVVAQLSEELGTVPVWRASLGETLGLLAQVDLVLCNDTGMAHVAAAVGTPTVVVFGPTDVVRWQPFGPHVWIVQSPTRRIRDVGTTEVLEAVRQGLDREAPQKRGAIHEHS